MGQGCAAFSCRKMRLKKRFHPREMRRDDNGGPFPLREAQAKDRP